MKCFLKNDCTHKNWCCNFCKLKCDKRCTDCHDGCKFFLDEPVEETDKKGNIRFFKYEKNAVGDFVRRYFSLSELTDILTAKRATAAQSGPNKDL